METKAYNYVSLLSVSIMSFWYSIALDALQVKMLVVTCEQIIEDIGCHCSMEIAALELLL